MARFGGILQPLALAAGVGLAGLVPAVAAHELPQVVLLGAGEVGPPQRAPIAAAAAELGRCLVARSEGDGQALALYELVAKPEPTAMPLPGASVSVLPPSGALPTSSPSTASDQRFSLLPFLPSAGFWGPATPAPTAPPPAFDVRLLAKQEDVPIDLLAMASNGRKAVLAVEGRDDQGATLYSRVIRALPGQSSPAHGASEAASASAVWETPAGASGLLGRPQVVARGPATTTSLTVALGPAGNALFAWASQLPHRALSLRTRSLAPDGTLGPLHFMAKPGFALQEPTLAADAKGFMLGYVQAAAPKGSLALQDEPEFPVVASGSQTSQSREAELAQSLEESLRSSLGEEFAPPSAWPLQAIVALPLDRSGKPAGEAFSEKASGLDHPSVQEASDGFHFFWTDPRAEGRELRLRAATAGGWEGPARDLRTDLRPDQALPYLVAPAGDGTWLAVWTQNENEQPGPMVVEGRLYFPYDLAISPPLLLGRADGPIALRALVPTGKQHWSVLWDALEGGQHHLMCRPLRIDD